jgi:hypothetical protein
MVMSCSDKVLASPCSGGAAFGVAGYYPNNFNDFASALVTLFELMVWRSP